MGNYSNHPLAGARDLDSAISLFWNFYKKNFVFLFIISLASALITSVITSNVDISKLHPSPNLDEILAFYTSNMIPILEYVLESIIFSVFLTVYVIEKPVGETFSLGKYLKKSITIIVPYLIALIFLAIPGVMLVSLGMFALVLPGIFAAFYVFTVGLFLLPVLIVEGINPSNALMRSLALTHRKFWINIGWVTIVMVLLLIFSFVITALIKVPFTGTLIKSIQDPGTGIELAKNPLFIGLTSVADALIAPVYPILAAILYFSNAQESYSEQVISADENRVRVEDLYPKMPEENKGE
jgi:hypothetical protein